MARPENHDHLPSSGSNLVTSHHSRNYKNADATFKIIIMHFLGGGQGTGGRAVKAHYLLPVLNVPCFKTRISSTELTDPWNFRIGKTQKPIQIHLSESLDISLKWRKRDLIRDSVQNSEVQSSQLGKRTGRKNCAFFATYVHVVEKARGKQNGFLDTWAPAWEKYFFQIRVSQKREAPLKERKFRNNFF